VFSSPFFGSILERTVRKETSECEFASKSTQEHGANFFVIIFNLENSKGSYETFFDSMFALRGIRYRIGARPIHYIG
jgi:hypothetical protein